MWVRSLDREDSPGGGHFPLENPMERRAWWAAVYGVAQSRTRLKRLSSSSSSRPWLAQRAVEKINEIMWVNVL